MRQGYASLGLLTNAAQHPRGCQVNQGNMNGQTEGMAPKPRQPGVFSAAGY